MLDSTCPTLVFYPLRREGSKQPKQEPTLTHALWSTCLGFFGAESLANVDLLKVGFSRSIHPYGTLTYGVCVLIDIKEPMVEEI
jgi:hypothetical protein